MLTLKPIIFKSAKRYVNTSTNQTYLYFQNNYYAEDHFALIIPNYPDANVDVRKLQRVENRKISHIVDAIGYHKLFSESVFTKLRDRWYNDIIWLAPEILADGGWEHRGQKFMNMLDMAIAEDSSKIEHVKNLFEDNLAIITSSDVKDPSETSVSDVKDPSETEVSDVKDTIPSNPQSQQETQMECCP
jgi:hypothetical protein